VRTASLEVETLASRRPCGYGYQANDCGAMTTVRQVLPEYGMRLQVPPSVGPVVDPLVPTKEPQEPTTVTPAEIIYHRRVQVLDRAGQTSVAEACRTFEISRTTSYRWVGRAQRYGLAALLPKGRRPPVMPTATPPDQVEAVLAEAVARPRRRRRDVAMAFKLIESAQHRWRAIEQHSSPWSAPKPGSRTQDHRTTRGIRR
jgi:transposase-like protein